MRDAHPKIEAAGAGIVAIGTGNQVHAKEFVSEEGIPFPVLVDDEAQAARAASVNRGSIRNILTPSTYAESVRTWREGHHIHAPGKRVLQLGATFVVGPGAHIGYEHIDATTTDHAPLDEVFTALGL